MVFLILIDGNIVYIETNADVTFPNGYFDGRIYDKLGIRHIEGVLTITSDIIAYSSIFMQCGIPNIPDCLIAYNGNSGFIYGAGYNVLTRNNISSGLKITLNLAIKIS